MVIHLLLFLVGLSLSACINHSYQLHPPVAGIHAVKSGKDCATLMLGLSIADLDVRRAMADGGITTLHSVTLSQAALFGLFGGTCIEVTGE